MEWPDSFQGCRVNPLPLVINKISHNLPNITNKIFLTNKRETPHIKHNDYLIQNSFTFVQSFLMPPASHYSTIAAL